MDGGGADVAGAAVFGEVLLVVIFRGVELGGGYDFRDDFILEEVSGFRFLQRGAGDLFLLGIVVENDGTVLRAFVRSLAVGRRGVVGGPKGVEQFGVRNFVGIKGDEDGFGMAG